MSSENTEQTQAPQQCSAGCGFFANMSGLCSKCYRDQESKRKNEEQAMQIVAQPQTMPSLPITIPSNSVAQESTTAPALSATGTPPGSSAPSSAPCRCNVDTCRKKLGLTGFKCKCGLSFCGSHRDADSHSCQFDYKAHGRNLISAANPLIQAEKVQRF